MQIPIIDIFAGPGGLGEGFSAAKKSNQFHIRLSIEMDEIAHKTLQLRSFLRSFGYGNFPEEYYKYVKEPDFSKDELFRLYPEHAQSAATEAWRAELGKEKSSEVHARIKAAIGDSRHWVLLGGPPCQAYSLVGRARRTGIGAGKENWSTKKQEELRQKKLLLFRSDEKHTLYKEYLKIVAVHKPTVFVMENVKGILSSTHDDEPVFERILADLRDPWKAIDSDSDLKDDKELHKLCPAKKPKYQLFSFTKSDKNLNSKDFIIRAEDYGIPQRRHRVIILGVLSDYAVKPDILKKSDQTVTVQQALIPLPKLRSGLSKEEDSPERWRKYIEKGFKSSVMKNLDEDIRPVIADALSSLKDSESRGGRHVTGRRRSADTEFNQWILDPKLDGVIQHETRGHMGSDLWRYLYAASYAHVEKRSPRIEDFPDWLLPDHKNVIREEGKEIHFKDRFKVQMADEPATTITSHIAKDGHYYIHYDPAQCRSLTVREAARLQTFPDNYFFEGNRTQQYHQIGNAVPPLLAHKLAHIVAKTIEQCIALDKLDNPAEEKKKTRA